MAEYVERRAIMDFPIRRDHCDKDNANEHFINGVESVLEYVSNLPAADVAPVVHGRWVRHEADGAIFASYECSVCSAYPTGSIRSHYCPNCGAKMNGGESKVDGTAD